MISINKSTIKNYTWIMVRRLEFKKMVLKPVFILACSDVVRKPVMGILNANPRLKEITKKIYYNFFLKISGIVSDNNNSFHRNQLTDISTTYKNLITYVLKKNTLNIDSNEEINRHIIALKETDYDRINARISEKNYRNIIIACYLNQLRRYPSENDIVLWSDHLTKGATVFTILNSLKNSPEFLQCGICYLE